MAEESGSQRLRLRKRKSGARLGGAFQLRSGSRRGPAGAHLAALDLGPQPFADVPDKPLLPRFVAPDRRVESPVRKPDVVSGQVGEPLPAIAALQPAVSQLVDDPVVQRRAPLEIADIEADKDAITVEAGQLAEECRMLDNETGIEAAVLLAPFLAIAHGQSLLHGSDRHHLVQVDGRQVPVVEADRRHGLAQDMAEHHVLEIGGGDRVAAETQARPQTIYPVIGPAVQVIVGAEQRFRHERVAFVERTGRAAAMGKPSIEP